MRKKLLIVTPYFYPKIGGMENYAYNICKGLKEKYGWEIVIATSKNEDEFYSRAALEGMKIYRLPVWFKISNTPINPLWYFQIRSIIKKENPDIINAHTPVPFISDVACRARGKVAFVLTYHGDLVKSNFFLKTAVWLYYSLIGNSTLKDSDHIISNSIHYAKKSPHLRNFLKKILIISPGVDPEMFQIRPQEKTNDILYVGRIEKNSDLKGIKYLLEAVSLIKKAKPGISLKLVGSGDRVDYFKEYAQDLGIRDNVFFAGQKIGADLAAEYQQSKLLVLPSINAESFGTVLIEAMAFKLPVIGSNIGGIPDVIEDNENGFLVEPRDPVSLSKKILEILHDQILAQRLGENGFLKAMNNYSWEKKIEITNDFFLGLTGRRDAVSGLNANVVKKG